MQIGGFFAISIFAAICAIFMKNGYLKMAIFFAAFCESCVIYTQNFFLSPGHFFVILAFFVTIIHLFSSMGGKFVFCNKYLTMFILIAFISILVSQILNIDVQVFGIGTGHNMKSSLVTIQNFTQLLYIIVGYLFLLMIVAYSYKGNKWQTCIKLIMNASVFILFIAVYQLIANRYNLPFVTIFKNPSKMQWQTMLRTQSTMGEASYLGQYCAYLSAIYLAPDYPRPKKRIISIAYIILLLFVSVRTFSATFLLGEIAVILTYALIEKKTRANIIKWILVIFAAVILVEVLIHTNSHVQQLVNNTISKIMMENYSGIERNEIFTYMMRIGLKYPILGIGYGGGRSRDLYSNLFANTGIIGLGVFAAFIIKDFRILKKNIDDNGARMCICILIVFLVTSLAIPDISYLTFWVFMGVVEAKCVELSHNKRTQNYKNKRKAEMRVSYEL